MIVKMEKVTILVSKKSKEEALRRLRKLGVVHIRRFEEIMARPLGSIEEDLATLEEAISLLSGIKAEEPQAKPSISLEPLQCAYEVVSLSREKQRLSRRLKELESQQEWFNRWGKFSLSSLRELQEAGVSVKFYKCPKGALRRISQNENVYILREEKNYLLVVLISTQEEELEYFQEEVPHFEVSEIERLIIQKKEKIREIQTRLKELALCKEKLQAYKKTLLKEIEFLKVKEGMKEEEEVCYLEGFSPRKRIEELKRVALEEGWGYIGEEPDNPEEVPTLLENPRWLGMIKPVFQFMGTLPGYKEYDVSFWFLLFLSLFFALLIGDAGYGFLFLFLTIFFRRRFPHLSWEPFVLMYVLSGATIIWGALSGTWFGYEKIATLPLFNSLIIDKINSFIESNQEFMMYFCFLIGAIHLTIAHGIVAVSLINSLSSLAQVGWICILWGIFFMAGKLVLDRPLPSFSLGLFFIGGLLVILFSNPQRNLLKGVLITLGDLPLKVISSFSDVVSYLRLFAVGYASVVVASSVNTMALSSGINNFWAGLGSALILFLGHSLNILLGLMAVVVHGIRLNMLEFSGHLNMQWSGRKYKPFKE